MKKTLVTAGATIATAALVALGTVSPASADVTVVAPISAPGDSSTGYGAAVSNDGSLAAAGIEYAGITIYNVAAGTQIDVTLADLGSNDIGHITFSPDNQYLYVADYTNSEVQVLKTSDGSIARTISLGFAPWMLEASQDGAYLYVSDYDNDKYYQIDLSDDSLSTAADSSSSSYQMSMCLSADGAKLYAPNYSDGVDVITTSDMSVTSFTVSGASELYSCEWDNDGNLIVGDYGNDDVYKLATDGTVLDSADLSSVGYVYAAAPSCDAIYVADEDNQASIPALDLATMDALPTVVPSETTGGDGFYGYNADRNLDGSVVVISGYYSSDALVIIKSSQCGASPELPNTGVDTTAMGISASVALGMLIAGAIAVIAIRRRNA